MPSKSRKKIKGQVRKAKAAAAKASTVVDNNNSRIITYPENRSCHHGNPSKASAHVVGQFIKAFFTSFFAVT